LRAAPRPGSADIEIVLMPPDVTHRALTSAARVAGFRALEARIGTAVADLLDFCECFDQAKYGTDGGPLHEPNVIAWLLAPGRSRGRDVSLVVETGSALTMGQTVIDWWGVTDRVPSVHVIREVDDRGCFALLLERTARL